MRMMRSAQAIRRDIEKKPETAALYARQRALAAYWQAHFSDSPELIGGWGHHYVCPSCGSQLTYDRESPDRHVCAACGQAYDSPDIREAWNAARRHDILAGLNAAALLFHVEGGEHWRTFVLDTLTWYADHYDAFAEHGRWVGEGKLMGHTLDEACWGVGAVRALATAHVDPMEERAQHIKHRLLVPMARLILSQPTNLMNISLWHAAFATGVGVYYRDVAFLYPMWKPHRPGAGDPFDFTRLCEANGARLLTENITPDGLWRENSISYHYYALSAAMEFYAFLREAELSEDGTWDVRVLPLLRDEQIRRAMLRAFLAPLRLLFPNGEMPATGDGWKYSLGMLPDMYVRAYFLLDDAPGEDRDRLAAVIYAAGPPRASLYTLCYGLPDDPGVDLTAQGSVHFAHNKMAMLRSGHVQVFFKYGNLCAGHSHPDALELSIYPIAMDPGSLSYGMPIHGGYFYVGGSHATFMIDGRSQNNAARGTARMDGDGLGISATVDNAFPGVTARRSVRIRGSVITDRMDITSMDAHQMDWLFHGRGDFAAEGAWQPAALPETTDGFAYFTRVVRLQEGQDLRVRWACEGYALTLCIPAIPGAQFFAAETPDNPLGRPRHAILVRKQGAELTVPARFELTFGQPE